MLMFRQLAQALIDWTPRFWVGKGNMGDEGNLKFVIGSLNIAFSSCTEEEQLVSVTTG